MKVLLTLSIILLSACTHNPNGKLSSSFEQGTVFEVQLVTHAPEYPVSVMVPNVQIHSMGLLGVMVAAASNEVSRQKRLGGINEIKGALKEKEINAFVKPLEDIVVNADWLKVDKLVRLRDYAATNRAEISKQKLASSNSPYQSFITSYYTIGESFENLSHNFNVSVYEMNGQEQGQNIYTLNLIDMYVPDSSVFDGEEFAYRAWTRNNGALTKKAINSTTQNLKVALRESLDNPYQSQ